jgi:sulfatase modifying factor 1
MELPNVPSLGLAVLAGVSFFTPAFAVSIDYVTVGNVGNAADTVTPNPGYGAVAYDYKVAKNEVSISQYAEFLNAAAKTDTYGLWNSNMGSDAKIAGITRGGSSGSYSYSVTGSGLRPITYVSWYDAARFTNWMHNGQGSGSTETGAYTLTGNIGIITKNAGATVWLPSEDEWYKAAYYDPNKGGTGVGGYWARATQSNTLAGNTTGVADSANYYDGDYVGSGSSAFPTSDALTDGGAYGANSQSAYGTNDQTGNVWEWNDAVIGSSRGLRGGGWNNIGIDLPSSYRDFVVPTFENYALGFRVASQAAPAVPLLLKILNITVSSGNVTLTGGNLQVGTAYHVVQATPSQLVTNSFTPVAGSEFTAATVTENAPMLATGGAPSLFYRLVRGSIP